MSNRQKAIDFLLGLDYRSIEDGRMEHAYDQLEILLDTVESVGRVHALSSAAKNADARAADLRGQVQLPHEPPGAYEKRFGESVMWSRFASWLVEGGRS